MTYRETLSTSGPAPIRFWQNALPARIALTILALAGMAFALAMAVWTTQDSYLDCTRVARDEAPSCSIEKTYPFSIQTRESLPLIRAARAEQRVSRGRGGARTHMVLVLDHDGAEPTEIPGIGTNGSRAVEVAADVHAFVTGDRSGLPGEHLVDTHITRGQARWHLRESVPAITVMMVALAGLASLLIAVAFRRTVVSYDPRERVVTVRSGRWPLRAKQWQSALAQIEGVDRVEILDQYGPAFSVRFTARGGGLHGWLQLVFRRVGEADRIVEQLRDAVKTWG